MAEDASISIPPITNMLSNHCLEETCKWQLARVVEALPTLLLEDGGKIKEKLLSLSPSGYRYAIVESPLPVKNYEASFSINSTNDELDIVWSASYDAADGKTDSDARAAIDGVFKSGIASIKSKLPDALKDRVREKADGALKN